MADVAEVVRLAERADQLEARLRMCDEAAAGALHLRASAVEKQLLQTAHDLEDATALAESRRALAERAVRPLVVERVGRVLGQMERRRMGGINRIQVDVDVLLEIRDRLLEIAGQDRPVLLS